MKDDHGRTIEYLRLSITDKCNLRCVYCMSEKGVPSLAHDELLNFQEIVRLTECLAGLGLDTVRLTGGEPMARRGCLELVKMISSLSFVKKTLMTTNGILLKGRMKEAKAAGLSSVNISLDSVDHDCFFKLTRGGRVEDVLSSVYEALENGIGVKLNAVPVMGINDDGIADIAALAENLPIAVRYIELMPVGYGSILKYMPIDLVKQKIEAAFGPLEKDKEKHGLGPAVYYRPRGFKGSIGFIGAISHEFCDSCNRVRITPDGFLKLCLNHQAGIDLKSMLRNGSDDKEITERIREAILKKPESHGFYGQVPDREIRRMNQIGG